MEKCPKCSYTFTPGDFLPNTSVDPSGQDFSMLLILEGPYNGLESNELNLEAPGCDGGQNELIIDSSVLNLFNYVEIGESVVDGNSTAVSISEAIGSAEVANLLSEDHVESTVAITEQSENINLSQMESLKVQSNRTSKDSNETVSTGSCESKSPRKKYQKSKGSKKGHLAASQFQYICEFCGLGYSGRCGLWRHRSTHHHGLKYSCDLCNKEFTRKQNLIRHKQDVHTAQR